MKGKNMQIDSSDRDQSNINRLLKALHHQEPDRLPHIELWVTSQMVYEYVLERKLLYAIGDAAERREALMRCGFARMLEGSVNFDRPRDDYFFRPNHSAI